jgi:imidazolonepropionase-like amidohydrolase
VKPAFLGLSLAAALGAYILAPAPNAQQVLSAQTKSQAFVIASVGVFDGERTRPDMNVVVEDGRIRAVDSTRDKSRRLPAIDGRGATLIPGFIDAHTHPRAVSDLQDALRFGVTAVLDMGLTSALTDQGVLRAAAASRVDVADYRSAGIFATSPGGHGTQFGVSIPTVARGADAEAFVEARKASGADYLKIMLNGVRTASSGVPNMTEDTARALVQAAHVRKMLVVAHVESLEDVRIALAAGVDGLAHMWRDNGPQTPTHIQRMVAQRVFLIASEVVPDALLPNADSRAALAADRRLAPFLTAPMRERLTGPPARDPFPSIDWQLQAIGRFHKAGGRLLTGTDAGGTGPSVLGVSLHRELELLVKSGLTPAEALTAATANVADAFRLTDRGRIMPGRRADLLLVRGDPTVDITATRDIVRVWRSGVEFDRRLGPP